MGAPLSVIFLWHMHQPYYRDPVKGEYALPWTYLHAVKDYFDMAAIVEDAPEARAVFNLVPSLLEQIREYAAGEAVDPFLIRGKMSPSEMDQEDRLFILENFFCANRQRMIEPNSRYLELFSMAGNGSAARLAERARQFSDQDILDLQVWFFLAWTGEAARRRYPEIRELIRKGRRFTHEDKALLFAKHLEILNAIIPLYKKLHEEGKAELSVTPYFHPILPLLCNMRSALTAMPRANLPAAKFIHPDDARTQVTQGVQYFEETFGFPPSGMWPSEGSVSDEALGIIAESGLKWVATDEDVLAKSLPMGLGEGKRELYHPYSYKSGPRQLNIFFRDHRLSDLIGFTYSQWEPKAAAADFIARLKEIRGRVGSGARVAPIILDGENAWEYYDNNAYDFLSALYAAVAAESGLSMATCSQVMEDAPPERLLTHIHPGSWINSDFGVWVGHPEENLAWDYLERAREAAVAHSPEVAAFLSGKGLADETAALVCKSLYAAEGSDWFWWYGDDHFSPHSDRFDRLFRKHLMNVYRLLNLEIPRELFEPIKKVTPAGLVREPAALITPVIDGRVTDYFEWLAAGLYDLTKQSSAMHASESLLRSLFYGYDRNFIYMRLDGEESLEGVLRKGDIFHLHLITEREYRVSIDLAATEGPLMQKGEAGWEESGSNCQWKVERICEARIPLAALGAKGGGKMFAFVTLMRNNEETGRWPTDAPLFLKYLGEELELENWLI